MEDFKWCVWLSPVDGHDWHGFIHHVPAHLSVAVYLETEAEAMQVARRLDGMNVRVRRNGPLTQTCTNGFYALVQSVALVSPQSAPWRGWWPAHAHVSFGYKYDAPFPDDELAVIRERLASRPHEADLCVCRVARATGRYHGWEYSRPSARHRLT